MSKKSSKCLSRSFGIVCQNCGVHFPDIRMYRQHVRSNVHKQNSKTMFKSAPLSIPGKIDIPWIVVHQHMRSAKSAVLVGLHMVTMCYSNRHGGQPFYLCHTCHEKCCDELIVQHLTSPEHCLSYFGYTKPTMLRFGWNPRLDFCASLKPSVEIKEETGPLMMLYVPSTLFNLAKESSYNKVMNDVIRKYLPASLRVEKMRTLALKERLDKENMHPILGLNFLVEYGTSLWLYGYLCLLCESKVHKDQVIAHLTCIDHLFSALASTHASSIGNQTDYEKHDPRKSSTILDVAEQAASLQPQGEVQVVKLDSDAYEEVDSLPFKSALDRLQTIQREQNQGDLQLPKNLLRPEPKLEQDQASESLWSYIKDKQRREPVIGLGTVIECHSEDQLPYYICGTCTIKMPQSSIFAHVTSGEHRCLYMMWKHRDLLHDWVDEPSLVDKAEHLLDLAQKLESNEGFGQAQFFQSRFRLQNVDALGYQVIELDLPDYEAVVLGNIDDALHKLRTIQSDLQIQTNGREVTWRDKEIRTSEETTQKDFLPSLSQIKEVPAECCLSSQASVQDLGDLELNVALDKMPTIQGEQNQGDLQLLKNLLNPQPKLEQDQAAESLWSYIKDKQRCEPVIGLGTVIECHSEDQLPYYICGTCNIKMPQSSIFAHVTSGEHRCLYMMWKHRDLLHDWVDEPRLVDKAEHLLDLAQKLESNEGFGQAQVLDLALPDYEEIVSGTVDDALQKLRTIQSDLQIQTNKRKVTWCDKELRTSEETTQRDPLPSLCPRSGITHCNLDAMQMTVHGPRLSHPKKVAEMQIPTQVYKMLWKFLHQKQRRDPVIGLRAIVEYHEENRAPYIVCEACGVTVPFVTGHLISAEHRYKYIRSHHPNLLNGWKEDIDISDYQDALEEKAKHLEKKEGLGDIQIRKKGKDGFQEVILPFTNELIDEPVQLQVKMGTEVRTQDQRLILEPGSREDSKAEQKIQKLASPQTAHLDAGIVKKEQVESLVTLKFPVPDSTSTESCMMTLQQSPCPSSKTLMDFLKSPHRSEPVIGLDHLTQVFSEDQPPYYVCDVCENKISRGFIINHIISAGHRYAYLKFKCPDLLHGCSAKSFSLTSEWKLKKAARHAEAAEGIGQMKLLKLDIVTYQKVVSASPCEALKMLQNICSPMNQMDFQSESAQEPVSGAIKATIAPAVPSTSTAPSDQVASVQSSQCLSKEGSVQEKTGEVPETLLTPTATEMAKERTQGQTPPLLAQDWISQPCAGNQALLAGVKCEVLHASVKMEPELSPTVSEVKKMEHLPVAEHMLRLPDGGLKMECDTERVACDLGGPALSTHVQTEPESVVRRKVFSRWVTVPAPALDSRVFHIKKDDNTVDESHLGKFLRAFLSNRAQPVIGLSKIVECRSFKQPTFYLCLSCLDKVDMAHICQHIIHWRHRFSYIKSEHPYLLKGWNDAPYLETKARLLKLAERVMDREGWGQAQVVKMKMHSYWEIASASFNSALDKLQIHRRQNEAEFGPLNSTPRLVTYNRKADPGRPVMQQPGQGLGNTLPRARVEPQMSVQCEPTPSPSTSIQQVPSQTTQEPALKPAAPDLLPQAAAPQEVARTQGAAAGEQKSSAQKRPLQTYLSSSKKDSAMLGLQMVLECHCMDDDSKPYYYLCQACSLKLTEELIVEHLCSSLHQYHYITFHQSWALKAVKKNDSLLGISDLLELASLELKKRLGSVKVQVKVLHESTYRKLAMGSYTSCMMVINGTDNTEEKCEGSSQTIKSQSARSSSSLCQHSSSMAKSQPILSNQPSAGKVMSKDAGFDQASTHVTENMTVPFQPNMVKSQPVLCGQPSAGKVMPLAVRFDQSSTNVMDNMIVPFEPNMVKSQPVLCQLKAGHSVIPESVRFDQSSTNVMDNMTVPFQTGATGDKTDISSDSPADLQKIYDLITELIVRKKLMDAQLKKSGVSQRQDGSGTCSSIQRETEQLKATSIPNILGYRGTSIVKEPYPGSLKQETPVDDGDPFSYENRQFTADPYRPSPQEGHSRQRWNTVAPLKRKSEHPEQEQQVKFQRTSWISSTLTVESMPAGGLIDPLIPTWHLSPEYWSSVTVNSSANVLQMQEQAPALQQPFLQSSTVSKSAGVMTRGVYEDSSELNGHSVNGPPLSSEKLIMADQKSLQATGNKYLAHAAASDERL